MNLKELQSKYHNKTVRVDSFYTLPEVDYIVTSVIDIMGEFVFAVRDVNYTIETKRWYTFKCATLEEMELVASRFRIIDG